MVGGQEFLAKFHEVAYVTGRVMNESAQHMMFL
jgi:hypothetical protein